MGIMVTEQTRMVINLETVKKKITMKTEKKNSGKKMRVLNPHLSQ